jgi:hypothetical protein
MEILVIIAIVVLTTVASVIDAIHRPHPKGTVEGWR